MTDGKSRLWYLGSRKAEMIGQQGDRVGEHKGHRKKGKKGAETQRES